MQSFLWSGMRKQGSERNAQRTTEPARFAGNEAQVACDKAQISV
jgi:hypothetical protein